jgi:YVTN family beta-propeller protein
MQVSKRQQKESATSNPAPTRWPAARRRLLAAPLAALALLCVAAQRPAARSWRAVVTRIVRWLGALAGLAGCCLAIGVASASAAAVVNTIPVGKSPWGVSSDGTHVWATNEGDDTVSEIDASTGTVIKTIPVGSNPEWVSSDGTHVWVANWGDGTVSEIDASTGTVVNTIPVGGTVSGVYDGEPVAVSSDGTHVWVANWQDSSVSEIDASTGTVVNTIDVGGSPAGVSSDGTHVWVTNSGGPGSTVSEIDASTGTVVNTIAVGPDGVVGVSSDGTHVWATNAANGFISELAASTGTVVNTITPTDTSLFDGPLGVSSDRTHVWVTIAGDDAVSEIDASTGTVVNTIPVGTDPVGVSSDGTHVWVTNHDADTVSEIQISAAPATPRPCASRQLVVSLGTLSAALGHLALPIRFRDRGGTCSLRGFPRVDGLSASGRVIIRAKRGLKGYFGRWRIATITLKNGQTASALLEGGDPAIFPRRPSSSRSLRITPPNDSHSVSRRTSYPLCYLTIHPVVAGRHGGGA